MTSLLLQEGGESMSNSCVKFIESSVDDDDVCVCVVGVEEGMESALIDIMVCAMRQAAEATPPMTRSQKKVRIRWKDYLMFCNHFNCISNDICAVCKY